MRRIVLLAAIAGAATAASGQIVFDNPWDASAIDAGAFSQPDQILAGEFDLAANYDVIQASWRGTMFSSDPLDTGDTWNFDVIFYNNNGGIPGGVLTSHAVVADVTDTNQDISGERVYIFDASFPAVSLAGGTTYFFTALNTGTVNTFRWNVGTDTSYSAWFTSDGGSSWADLGDRSPLNFQLAIPAPASATVLGLAGLAAIRRRR